MPKTYVWNLSAEDLPDSGVRFRLEGGRRLYYWLPCVCCGRPTVFKDQNRRLDPVLTFFARDVDQGPHLEQLSALVDKSFTKHLPDPEMLIDLGDLLAEVEMNNLRIAAAIRYSRRLTMSEVYPQLRWPKSWIVRQ